MAPISHHLEAFAALTLTEPFDPHAGCIRALYSAVSQILLSGHGTPYQVSFLKAAMKFMAAPRSESDHAQLRHRFFTCHCDRTNPQMVYLHDAMPPALTVHDLWEATLFLMCSALQNLIAAFKHNRTAHDVHQRWPAADADFHGSGSARGLWDALIHWPADGCTSTSAFSLIAGIARAWPEFAMCALGTPRLFALATTHLESALARIPTHDTDVLWAPRFSIALYACVAELFPTFALDRVLRGILPRMLAVAERMQSHVFPGGDRDMQASIAWFERMCSRYGRTFVPQGNQPAPYDSRPALLTTAWGALFGMRNSKCTAPNCRVAETQRTGHVCSKCLVARYCTVDHQRAAWRSQQYPHKAVCAAIGRLRTALAMENDQIWTELVHNMEAGRSSRPFEERCIAYNVSPDLGREILLALGYDSLSQDTGLKEVSRQFTTCHHGFIDSMIQGAV
ncbi:hypothetical protein B0H17DRAFT_1129858 [Mycena rosella]|uniref:MYND-type domain-containing protein n=1 Tax=Mycena rosella TaxID=1033263 RepID=A0AAD7GJS5_MYCRO|nr:hypothetical protein B0H17DRAFT_1129858 [Mycena rosella]